MEQGIDLDSSIMENVLLSRMVFVHWVVIPRAVVVRIDLLDTRLNDRIAASKAREFRDVDRRTLKRNPDSSRVHDGVIFRVAIEPTASAFSGHWPKLRHWPGVR